jgi:hypothetical protein
MKRLLPILLLSGCFPHKKLAEICLEKYPPIIESRTDTLRLIDTIPVIYNSRDTFYIDTTVIIREVKTIESTARLEVERKRNKKAFDSLYAYDMAIILDLNKQLGKTAKDTSKMAQKIRTINKERDSLKKDADKYKYLFLLSVLFLVGNMWLKARSV